MSAGSERFQARALVSLLVAVLVVQYLPAWTRGPLEIVVTFFHEAGHALTALLTGGSVDRFVLEANGTGYAQTRGGIRLLVMAGGYLGATLAGAAILRANGLPRIRLFVLEALGVGVAGMVVLYGGDLFTTGYGLLMAACFFGVGRVASEEAEFHLTNFVGVLVGTGALKDLWSLVQIQLGSARVLPAGLGHTMTDAEAMAQATGLPAILWALAWGALSIWILGREVDRAARSR